MCSIGRALTFVQAQIDIAQAVGQGHAWNGSIVVVEVERVCFHNAVIYKHDTLTMISEVQVTDSSGSSLSRNTTKAKLLR